MASTQSSNIMHVIGENYFGQLGRISIGDMQSVLTTLPKDITNIYTGRDYSIFRDIHNNYYSAGYNQEGSCGTGNKQPLNKTHNNAYIPFSPVNTKRLQIHSVCVNVSSRSTFWITNNNQIYANGSNDNFQLGIQNEIGINDLTLIPCLSHNSIMDIQPAKDYTVVLGLANNITIQIIQYWATLQAMSIPMEVMRVILKLLQVNKVYSSGKSTHGGDGHDVATKSKTDFSEIVIFKNKNIVKIRVGFDHSLFLQHNGVVWSCGRNDCGQTGTVNEYNSNINTCQAIPIEFFVSRKIKVKDIECGTHHSLCIDENGLVWSWGLNSNGQCGVGYNNTNIFTPVVIKDLIRYRVDEINCGCCHSYCRTMNGKHWLFGSNCYNECITFDQRKCVLVPFYINDVVKEKTNDGNIISISLGQYSTIIIVSD